MARTARSGHTTTDHDFIRGWVEERGGWPARVKGTGGKGDPGLIRVDFPGFSGGDSLERIGWEDWFQGFDGNNLAFLHRDISHGGGDLDRFNKLITRTGDEDGEGGERGSSGGRTRGRTGAAGARSSASRARASSGTTRGRGRSASSESDSGSSRSSGGRSSSSRSASTSSRSSASKSASGRSSSSAKTGTSRSGAAAKSNGRSTSTSSRSRSSRGGAETSSNGGAMAGGEMRELLLHELGDLLFAEKQFLAGTKTMAKEALDPAVKTRVEEHVTETEGHIERLKQAFQSIGERPKAVKCEAAQGLREEHDSFKSEEKPSKTVMSAFSLGSGLRVEHYEIAAYRTAIALAGALGQKECASILKENLKEEMAMASFLEKAAPGVLKRAATMA